MIITFTVPHGTTNINASVWWTHRSAELHAERERKLEISRVQVPIIPHGRVGAARIAGMDIRRFIPRRT